MPVFDGRYAPYIWAVYILLFVSLTAMVLVTAIRARKAKTAHDEITKAQEQAK